MPFAIHLTQSAQVWASTGRQTRCSILATKVRYLMAMALFLTYIGLKNLVLDLILALQTLPTARLLPSPNNRGTLFGDLLRLPMDYHPRKRQDSGEDKPPSRLV